MKILKKQGLMLMLIAALVVTLTLGIIFMLPARTVKAEEFSPEKTVNVSTEQQLKNEITNAGTTATRIVLDADIKLEKSEVRIDQNQKIAIDLKGHTLSRAGRVIMNSWGKLYLEDSSAEKTGTIADANTGNGTNVMGLVYNYGEMYSNVNYDVVYSSCVAVTNQLSLSNKQYICNPSLTITGGTIKHRGNAHNGVTLLKMIDGNLTITGGTFITGGYQGTNSLLVDVSSTDLEPEFFPWDYMNDDNTLTPEGQEKVNEALKELKGQLEVISPHRQSTITIEGGDFTAFSPKCGVIKVALNVEEVTEFRFGTLSASWGKDVVGPYTATVSITGGRWGRDLSGYVGDGYWMEHVQETSQSGEIIEEFYQVALADSAKAEASVTVNDKEKYYTTVSAAFNAAKTTVANEHTIKLLKNATVKTISLRDVSGDIVLDLNGHKLKVDPESSSAPHVDVSSNSSYKNTLVIRDTSHNQDGVLELCASKGVGVSSFFQFYTGNTKVRLESGTISQTGLVPASYKDYSIDEVTRSNDDYLLYMSLFKLSPISDHLTQYANNYQGLVTIQGGSIVSSLNFGTDDNIVATHPGVFVGFTAPNSNNNEFGVKSKDGDKVPGKENMIIFDLESYLADGTKSCKFSWDFNELVAEKGLTSSETSDGYIVSKASKGEYFIVGPNAKKTGTLQEALDLAGENDTISLLQNATVAKAVTINKGITLNLNSVANFELKFEKGVTFTGDGASVRYGNLVVSQGAVTVAGNTTFDSVTLDGNVTVSGGTLTILSGTYKGEFTVSGGDMAISGGSFKGSQIGKLDQYFGEYLGALDESNGYDYDNNTEKLYDVKLGPNLAAQEWYKKFSDNEYTIGSVAEWKYFSLYVNSGIDNFKGRTVKLTAEEGLNFDPNAAKGIALAAEAQAPNFLPAGNKQHAFAGTFDGGSKPMKNIVAQERAVGLFGYTTGDSRFRNIILENCTFNTGNGFLDEFNGNGYYAGGALIGEGFMGGNVDGTDWSGNITLNGVQVGYDPSASNFIGGVIGHSWGNVYIDDLKFKNETTVSSNWKMGGVVGYLEGEFYIKKAHIEEGTEENPKNGLILDDRNAFFAAGALVGHANGSKNTIEDCKILEPDDSLIGTTYAGGSKSNITIQGKETDLDIHRVVGAGRAEGSTTDVVLSQEVTEEDGVKRGSVKLKETENGMKFYETDETGERTELEVQRNPDGGGFEAVAKLDVTIGKIAVPAMTYSATEAKEATLTSFVLYNELGNELTNEEYQYLKNLNVVVTLQLSSCTVGKRMALITSYTITGADANKYNFQLTGNQTFVEAVEVAAAMLQVSVNDNGEVEYDGFVGGEDESVLGGTLTLDKVDNGDGTYTVTPSGLESENYNIVYVSSVVPAAAFETESNALWIALAVVGSAILLLGAVAVVYAVRKRKE